MCNSVQRSALSGGVSFVLVVCTDLRLWSVVRGLCHGRRHCRSVLLGNHSATRSVVQPGGFSQVECHPFAWVVVSLGRSAMVGQVDGLACMHRHSVAVYGPFFLFVCRYGVGSVRGVGHPFVPDDTFKGLSSDQAFGLVRGPWDCIKFHVTFRTSAIRSMQVSRLRLMSVGMLSCLGQRGCHLFWFTAHWTPLYPVWGYVSVLTSAVQSAVRFRSCLSGSSGVAVTVC